jgi:hypothetical protein
MGAIAERGARLVTDARSSRTQPEGLARIAVHSSGYPFRFRSRELPRPVPGTESGQFEKFVCLAQ